MAKKTAEQPVEQPSKAKIIEREGVVTFVSHTLPNGVEIERQAKTALNQAITSAQRDGISILDIGKVTAGVPEVKDYEHSVWGLKVVVQFKVPV